MLWKPWWGAAVRGRTGLGGSHGRDRGECLGIVKVGRPGQKTAPWAWTPSFGCHCLASWQRLLASLSQGAGAGLGRLSEEPPVLTRNQGSPSSRHCCCQHQGARHQSTHPTYHSPSARAPWAALPPFGTACFQMRCHFQDTARAFLPCPLCITFPRDPPGPKPRWCPGAARPPGSISPIAEGFKPREWKERSRGSAPRPLL